MSAMVERAAHEVAAPPAAALDDDSRRWLRDLRATGSAHEDAVERLHALLLRAARFEVSRRRGTAAHLRGDALDDIATEDRAAGNGFPRGIAARPTQSQGRAAERQARAL